MAIERIEINYIILVLRNLISVREFEKAFDDAKTRCKLTKKKERQ